MIHPSVYKHESSYIDQPCSIGAKTKIYYFCHVMAGARIGAECVLGQNVNVAGKAVIGDRVHIQNNVSVYDGVTLEDDVFVGPSVVFTNVKVPKYREKSPAERTLVRKGARIGANATIICGVTIGEYALIGAGAVVTKDVPAGETWYGNPARSASHPKSTRKR